MKQVRRLVDWIPLWHIGQPAVEPRKPVISVAATLGRAKEDTGVDHRAKRVAERLAGRPVPGFSPPEERFTPATLQIWADLGGRYVVASNNGRAAGPEILPLLPDSLILLGRVADDDYAILDRSDIHDRARISQRLLSQIGESIAYRGLYLFSYHSRMLSQQQLIPVLQELASRLRRTPEIWTATAGEVAEWWRERAGIALTPASDGRSVTLVNRGPREFTGGRLVIDAPAGARQFVSLPVIPPRATVHVDDQGRVATVAAPAAQRPVAARWKTAVYRLTRSR